MMKRSASTPLAVLCFTLLASVAYSQGTYTEDFSTATLEDVPNTTADWNTATGRLGLFPFAPSLVTTYDTPNSAESVVIQGDLAFVADLQSVRILDIEDPSNPTPVGSFVGNIREVAVDGDLLYAAGRAAGLLVYDVSDPTTPVQLGAYDTAGSAEGVVADGDLVYVADYAGGLVIIDVSDPASPTALGSFTTSSARRVAVSGNRACVADETMGLLVFDVSDPANPDTLGSFDDLNIAYDVDMDRDRVFVANYAAGLRILDISGPAAPALVGTYNTLGLALDVVARGDRAYVADGGNGLVIIDISNPSAPALAGTLNLPGINIGCAVSGEFAYLAARAPGLHVARIGHATPLTPAGGISTPGDAWDVAVAGDVAYVADGSALRIYDITDPASPAPLGSLAAGAYPITDVVLAGRHAYIGARLDGVSVVDISDPLAPTVVGSIGTASQVEDIAVAGDLLYVADFADLLVIDISDPTTPSLVTAFPTIGACQTVEVEGDRLYLGEGFGHVEVLDISDAANPVSIANPATNGARCVTVEGNLMFVGGLQLYDMRIYDVTVPTAPVQVGQVGTFPSPGGFAIEVSGDRAFVTRGDSTVIAVDITDPTNPVVVDEYGLGAPPSGGAAGSGLVVAGQNVFVAASAAGIHVLQAFQDESDPAGDAGRSLPVDTTDDLILSARLAAVEAPGVSWEISADAGLNWQPIDAGAGWSPLAVPGADLVWRTSHAWQGQNPTVDAVTLDWLYQYGLITTIADVPDDQGGWLRLSLNRSGLDAVDEASTPVTGYQIYQRVDDAVLASAAGHEAADDAALTEDAARIMASFGPDAVRTVGDRTFVVSASVDKAAAAFPAGTWEAVGWVAATQNDGYTARVPTVADSTAAGTTWSVYLVTTHTTTPSVWFASAPDSGYSVDNIAPAAPQNLAANYTAGAVDLDWADSPETDFQFYRIYRDGDPGFAPSPATLLTETATSDLVDATLSPWGQYYKVTAVDHAGNESPAAAPLSTSGVGDTPLPGRVVLNEAVPNPFNPTTVLAFSLPKTDQARLTIHDVSGRVVRVLADGVMTAGRHEFVWDGSDRDRRRVASGVYFFRLEAGSTVEVRRMVMVK